MKITSISQQEKLKNRYSIYVDEKYAFSLSDTALLESKLYTGLELTKDEVGKYKELSKEDKIYGLILRYSALRPRSQWELEFYMKRKDVPAPLQTQILNKLSDYGFVDDRKFAEAWVQNRRLLKSTSRRRLQLELRTKHVADEIIQEVLAEDKTDDRTALLELVERKRKQTKYQDKTKLMQYLARQGFSYDDIKSVLTEEYGKGATVVNDE
jgi:regulatory protein